MKLLIDEMYEGYVKTLRDRGFEVYSVKQLINEGKKLRSDYSVLTYAKENSLTLISADIENQIGCQENNIPYVRINSGTILNTILSELNALGSAK